MSDKRLKWVKPGLKRVLQSKENEALLVQDCLPGSSATNFCSPGSSAGLDCTVGDADGGCYTGGSAVGLCGGGAGGPSI